MKLTTAERLVIRNQLVLMKALKVPPYTPAEYDEQIQILDSGYEAFYNEVTHGLADTPANPAVVAETMEILDLFRALHDAGQRGLILTNGSLPATFGGFDGNNDDHYSFSVFLLNTKGSYTESGPAKNSHTSGTLIRYRRMLAVWQSQGSPYALTQAQVDAILK